MTEPIPSIWQEINSLRRDRHELTQRVQKLFSDFDGHLILCTQRHKEIRERLDLILSIIKWVSVLSIGILVGIIGFFVKRDLFP